jgi:tetratricopeptide (TPR) repeat protein
MDPGSADARLSNYRLERLLGAGGMGSVYLARDLALDRPVAIKFISPDRAADPVARQRLIREARAAASLDHPNICVIHEVIDEPGGRACIVMQYVEGETLASKLQTGPLDVRLALSIAADLASALSVAHRHGVIHRDIKPHNIVLTPDNHSKLLDFGLALQNLPAASNDETTASVLTAPGALAGTPAYMSPEQVQGVPLDGRSDLFSLGSVLYECLTGRRAFIGTTPYETAHNILQVDSPDPSSVRPDLHPQHDELCRRLLAKHRDDRFQSADELLGALRVSSSGAGSRPRLSPSTDRTELRPPALSTLGLRPFQPGRFAALVLLALLPLGAVALAGWAAGWGRQTGPAGTVVGVLPFQNASGNPANDSVAAGLTEAVAKRLASVPTIQVLALDETREAAREQQQREGTSAKPGARPEDIPRMARSLGAAFLVDGAIVAGSSGLEVVAALARADGTRHGSGQIQGTSNIFELHQRTADALIATLAAQGAIAETRAAVSQPTTNADAFAEYSQGRVFLERQDVPGNLDHAIKLFQSAIAKDPRFALAHAGLAETYWAQFQETQDPAWTARAMTANLEALRIDPDQPEVRMSLALAYRAQGELDKAAEELRRVMALQPRNDSPHRVLADIRAARSEWVEAVAEAQQAVALRSSYWRNHHQLGMTYFRAGRYPEAAEAFGRVVELQPDSARGYQTLGTALQAAGRNDEALQNYEKALAIRPSGQTYSNVGTLYFWRGDHAAAARAYEKAVALLPSDPELQSNLGDAYSKLGQGARAAQAYRLAAEQVSRLLAVSPNDPQRLAALGLYRAKLGERSAARDAIAKARAISPENGQVLYASALVHALTGDPSGACAALGSALANGASVEEVRHAGELRTVEGCAAYDGVVKNVR